MTLLLDLIGWGAWVAAGYSHFVYKGAHVDALAIVGAIFLCGASIVSAIQSLQKRIALRAEPMDASELAHQLELIEKRLLYIQLAVGGEKPIA